MYEPFWDIFRYIEKFQPEFWHVLKIKIQLNSVHQLSLSTVAMRKWFPNFDYFQIKKVGIYRRFVVRSEDVVDVAADYGGFAWKLQKIRLCIIVIFFSRMNWHYFE